MHLEAGKSRLAVVILLLAMALTPLEVLPDVAEMQSALKKSTGKARIKLLVDLGFELRAMSPADAIKYLDESIYLSAKYREDTLKSKSYRLKGLALLHLNQLDSAKTYFDESISLSDKIKDTLGLGSSYYNKGLVYLKQSRFDSVISYMNKAGEIYSKLAKYDYLSDTYSNISYAYRSMNNYSESLEYLYKNAKLNQTIGDSVKLANIYVFIGDFFAFNNEYSKAQSYFIKANHLFRSLNDTLGISNSLANMATLIKGGEETNKAITLYQKALSYLKKSKYTINKGRIYSQIGNLYIYNEDYDSAKVYHTKSAETFLASADTLAWAGAIQNLAYIAYNTGNSAEFLSNANLAHNIFLKYEHDYGIVESASMLGAYYLNQGKLKESEEYIKLHLSSAKKIEYEPGIQEAHKSLYDLYMKLGKYKEAAYNLKMAYDLRDSINTKQNQLKVAELNFKFNNSQREKDLKKNKDISDLKLQRAKTINLTAIISLVILTIGLVLLFRLNKKNKSMNKELEYRNKELEKSKSQLGEQKEELALLNTTKDKFFSIIAHDLRNPISSNKNLLELIDKSYDTFTQEELKEVISELVNSSSNLSKLLENLLQWSRINLGRIQNNSQEVSIADLVATTVDLHKAQAKLKNISLEITVADGLKCFADPNMLSTVLRNLLSNSIKFTPNYGKVSIIANDENNEIAMVIKDNGLGMNPNLVEKLFRIDTKVTSVGTNNESGTGLGLILVKEFLEKNNGRIKVKSTEGIGSEFTIYLPKIREILKESE